MSAIIHDNSKRFAKTFSKHWLPYTLTIDGSVIWSGTDPNEIPKETIRGLVVAADDMSLYQMITTVAKAIK